MTRRRRSKQKKKITSNKLDYYLPEELIEPILQNLPVKSLIRFSTASKLWNSIIFRPKFGQNYRGREIILLESLYHKTLACPLSSMSFDNPMAGTTPFQFPPGSFLASCGNLWCFEFENSLLLYNPSIHTYRKFPNPKMETDPIDDGFIDQVYVYGLGYDSASDDYKILKIRSRNPMYNANHYLYLGGRDSEIETEIYSLRSGCWRKVESQPPQFIRFLSEKGLLVSGKLHWLVTRLRIENGQCIENNSILSFDLSEDKFGLIELPDLLSLPNTDSLSQVFDMIVFGGKLHVYQSYVSTINWDCKFSVWVMEDYEYKLWIHEMGFGYGHIIELRTTLLRPFYFYDDARNLVRAVTKFVPWEKIFIYKGGSFSTPATLVEKNFGSNGFSLLGMTYVESLVNPLTWHVSSTKADDDDDGGSSTKMGELKLSS